MYFLMDKFRVRKTTNTEQLLEEPNESEIGEAIDENPENTEGDADATLDRDNGSNQNHNTETVSTPNTEKRKSLFQSPKAKRTPNKKSRSDEAYSILKQTVENRNHRDESAIFGEHVANKHRKYNQHTRSIVEHLIADIFFKPIWGITKRIHKTGHLPIVLHTPLPFRPLLLHTHQVNTVNLYHINLMHLLHSFKMIHSAILIPTHHVQHCSQMVTDLLTTLIHLHMTMFNLVLGSKTLFTSIKF